MGASLVFPCVYSLDSSGHLTRRMERFLLVDIGLMPELDIEQKSRQTDTFSNALLTCARRYRPKFRESAGDEHTLGPGQYTVPLAAGVLAIFS